ncbi:MAG: AsmA family protein [Halioglobus sp.]
MLRILFTLISVALGLALVAILAVSLLRIPIDVSTYKGMIESTASQSLGRDVKVDGNITVTTSLWPYFEIQGLRISNPTGFSDDGSGSADMATMNLARVTVGLVPLLQRRISIREFRVNGIELNLVRNNNGRTNWVFDEAESNDVIVADNETETDPEVKEAARLTSLSVDEIVLEDIQIHFTDAMEPPLTFALERAQGSAPLGEPMQLELNGKLLEETFTLNLNASSLAGFLAMTRAELEAEFEIAKTKLVFTGRSDALRGSRSSRLRLATQGADLSSLNNLLRLDLPPIQDYQFTANLHVTPGKLELTTLEAIVKDSKLSGSAVLDRTGTHPVARIELAAENIQLRDFDTGDWTAENGATDSVATDDASQSAATDLPEEQAARPEKLLSAQALQRADVELSVKVGEVRSGEDFLGSANLSATLKSGRIELAPLQLQLPQASLLVQASLKPGKVASHASLKVKIDNFDFGVLSRLSDPASEVGGIINVDLDVSSTASNANLLAGADGYFDVSAKPTGLQSGLVDLWAVNLLSSVVSSASKGKHGSEVNCMISRFRLNEGVMTAEQIAVDTSRIRICGAGKVSFADGSFNLVATPKAKKAEFFGLATPLKVKGEFDDFRVSMKGGALTLGTTAVSFAISPVTTPFKRLFQKELPKDGNDVCSLPIGPRTQELEPTPGC